MVQLDRSGKKLRVKPENTIIEDEADGWNVASEETTVRITGMTGESSRGPPRHCAAVHAEENHDMVVEDVKANDKKRSREGVPVEDLYVMYFSLSCSLCLSYSLCYLLCLLFTLGRVLSLLFSFPLSLAYSHSLLSFEVSLSVSPFL